MTAGVPQDEEGPQDIETTIRELQVRPGFEGYFLFNDLGIPIKWSSSGFGENSASSGVIIPREVTHFAALMADLSAKSQDTCDHLFADKVSARSTGRQPVPLRSPRASGALGTLGTMGWRGLACRRRAHARRTPVRPPTPLARSPW